MKSQPSGVDVNLYGRVNTNPKAIAVRTPGVGDLFGRYPIARLHLLKSTNARDGCASRTSKPTGFADFVPGCGRGFQNALAPRRRPLSKASRFFRRIRGSRRQAADPCNILLCVAFGSLTLR